MVRALVVFSIVGVDMCSDVLRAVRHSRVATLTTPGSRFFSTGGEAVPPTTRPTELPDRGAGFEPLKFLYVNKLPLVAALLAGRVPGGSTAFTAVCVFALCMRRSGKSCVLRLLKLAAEGDLAQLRWLTENDAVKEFTQAPGWSGFQLFTTKLPVIFLDFSDPNARYIGNGSAAMAEAIRTAGAELGIMVEGGDDHLTAFNDLVTKVRAKFVDADGEPKRIVLLIDEYDAPITTALKDEALSPEEMERMLIARVNTMSELYSSVKGKCTRNWFHLVFVTGVMKASGVSMFSGANNFVSLFERHPEFAGTLFGLTEEEIKTTYGTYIAKSYRDHLMLSHHPRSGSGALSDDDVADAVMAELRRWYNGYKLHPLGGQVYNTVSVMESLIAKSFVDGWTANGPPASAPVLTSIATDLSVSEIDRLVQGTWTAQWNDLQAPVHVANRSGQAVRMAFQCGLATIKQATRTTKDYSLVLGAPNEEVKAFLRDRKFELLLPRRGEEFRMSLELFAEALVDGMPAGAAKAMAALLAIATSHSNMGKEADVGGVLLGHVHEVGVRGRPYFFEMEVSGDKKKSAGRGRPTAADGVLVSLRNGDNEPVMVVVELKRVEDGDRAVTTRTVNGAVDQVINKHYFENAMEAVNRYCGSPAGRGKPFCPAVTRVAAANQYAMAIVALVPRSGRVDDALRDEIDDRASEREVRANRKRGSVNTKSTTTKIVVTGSGVAVAEDRRVAVFWKAFRPLTATETPSSSP
jgi:hypothetical protein